MNKLTFLMLALGACVTGPDDDDSAVATDETTQLSCGNPAPAFTVNLPPAGTSIQKQKAPVGSTYGGDCTPYYVGQVDQITNRAYGVSVISPTTFGQAQCSNASSYLRVEAYHPGVLLGPGGQKIPPGYLTLSDQTVHGTWNGSACVMPNGYTGQRSLAYSNLRVSVAQIDTHGVPVTVTVQVTGN